MAVLATSLLIPAGAAAKPPKISQAEAWPASAFKNDKYVAHETCGEPVKVSQWEAAPITGARTLVEATALCIKLTVQEECGCRTYETTYRKYKGQAKYGYHSVGKSVAVDCPTPLPPEQVAKCKEKADAEASCATAPSVQFPSGGSMMRVKCAPESGLGAGLLTLAHCKQCEPLVACMKGPHYTPPEEIWKQECSQVRCAAAVKLGIPGHAFSEQWGSSFECTDIGPVKPKEPGKNAQALTKDMCGKCVLLEACNYAKFAELEPTWKTFCGK